jgi:AAA domain
MNLPEEITEAKQQNSRDLVLVSIPKMGKSSILGDFTKTHNALVFDLEKGGYEYVSARKSSIYDSQETTFGEAFENYIKIRNLLLENKGKYEYLIIDGLSDLDVLSDLGGTMMYMNTVISKNFNVKPGGRIKYGEEGWKSVTTLPDGAGYQHTRKWFLEQVEIFRQISPFRIWAAHTADKYVKDNNKEEVVGSEIFLTGKLKNIFASKVTSLAKLIADGDKRYLSFDVLNDSIIAGSRNPRLQGKILISEKDKKGNIITYWDKIYN